MKRKIEDVMTRIVEVVTPDMSVRDVATRMKDRNIGSYPVCDGGSLIGMVTDRDLALRVLAEGRDPDSTPVEAVMSTNVSSCTPEDRLDDVLALMGGRQLRRIPVVGTDGRVVGLVTLGKIAETDCEASGEVLRDVVRSAGDDAQVDDA